MNYEPNFFLQIFFVRLLPFVFYFSAVFLRNQAWPKTVKYRTSVQIGFGIIFSLAFYSGFVTLLRTAFDHDNEAFLTALVIFSEQGLLQESLLDLTGLKYGLKPIGDDIQK